MRSFKFIAILVVAALCSCTNDPIDEGGAANVPTGIDRKIMTSSLESEQGELLVKFSDEAIAAVETGVTRTEATRTGLQRFDAALTDIEAVSLERVFPDIPKHEAQGACFRFAPLVCCEIQPGGFVGYGGPQVGCGGRGCLCAV